MTVQNLKFLKNFWILICDFDFWTLIFGLTFFPIAVTGCSDIRVPTFRYAATHPWDTKTPLRRGLTKQAVIKKWGEPDEIIPDGWDETGLKKEKWIYRAWFPKIPIDYRYLSKSKCLFFIGDNLVDLKDLEEAKKNETLNK